MILNSGFWPLFWSLIAGGVAVTALLTLLISAVPARRPVRHSPSLASGQAPRHGTPRHEVPRHEEEPARHMRAA
jgi:hypothetical protein